MVAEVIAAIRVDGLKVQARSEDAPEQATDPVCGMSVTIASARQTAEVDGVVYYFCCANCRARFLKDPQAHLVHS